MVILEIDIFPGRLLNADLFFQQPRLKWRLELSEDGET
jgi:hypothetical protein